MTSSPTIVWIDIEKSLGRKNFHYSFKSACAHDVTVLFNRKKIVYKKKQWRQREKLFLFLLLKLSSLTHFMRCSMNVNQLVFRRVSNLNRFWKVIFHFSLVWWIVCQIKSSLIPDVTFRNRKVDDIRGVFGGSTTDEVRNWMIFDVWTLNIRYCLAFFKTLLRLPLPTYIIADQRF